MRKKSPLGAEGPKMESRGLIHKAFENWQKEKKIRLELKNYLDLQS